MNEQLLLHIKIQVEKAVKDLAKLQGSIDGLGKSGKRGIGTTNNLLKDQIINLNKLNPLITQQSRAFVASEKAKQREIEKTAQLQLKQQKSVMGKIGGAILPGIGAGIGIAAAQMAVKAMQAIGEIVKRGVDFNAFIEASQAMFTVLLRDGNAATNLMSQLRDVTMQTTLSFKETAGSAKQLLAYGFDAGNVVDTMRILADMTAATGTRLDDLAYIYGTLRTQGKAYSRDLLQFAQRGIPIYEELAKTMGMSSRELLKLVKAGKVDIMFEDVEKAFINMTKEGGIFFGSSEARMKTLLGMTDQIEKKSDIVAARLGKMLEPLNKAWAELQISMLDGLEAIASAIAGKSGDTSKSFITNQSNEMALDSKAYNNAGQTNIGDMLLGEAIKKDLEAIFVTGIYKGMWEGFSKFGKNFYNIAGSSMAVSGGNFQAGMTNIDDIIKLSYTYAKQTGVEQLKVLDAMVESGLVTRSAFQEASKYVRDMRDDQMRAADYWAGIVDRGAKGLANLFGLDLKSLGITTKGSPISEKQLGIGSETILDELTPVFDSMLANAKTLSTQGKMPEILEDANKNIAQQAEGYIENLTAMFNKSKTLQEAIAKTNPDQAKAEGALQKTIIELIEGLSKYAKLDDKVAKEQKTKALAKDPGIWEDMIPTFTRTKTDDLERERVKRLAEITEAYSEAIKDGTATQLQLNGALTATTDQYQWLIKQVQSSEDANKGFEPEYLKARIDAIGGGFAETWKLAELDMVKSNREAYDSFVEQNKALGASEWKLALEKFNKEIDLADKKFQYEKKMARAEKAFGGDQAFWDKLTVQGVTDLENGNQLAGVGKMATSKLMSGTEIGTIISAGEDWWIALIGKIVDALKNFEAINKVLNGVTTMLKGMFDIVGYLITHALQPLVNIIEYIGPIIGELLSPFAVLADMVTTIAYLIITRFIPPIEILAKAFEWFSDEVMIPLGNGLIDIVNGAIDGINDFLKSIGAELIPRLTHILKSSERANEDDKESQEAYNNILETGIKYLKDKLKGEVDSTVSSLQKLYEVGAISDEQYEEQSKAAIDKYREFYDDQYALLKQGLPDLNIEGLPNIFNVSNIDDMITALQLLQKNYKWNNDGNPNTIPMALSDIDNQLGIIAANTSKLTTIVTNTANTAEALGAIGIKSGPALTTSQSEALKGVESSIMGYAEKMGQSSMFARMIEIFKQKGMVEGWDYETYMTEMAKVQNAAKQTFLKWVTQQAMGSGAIGFAVGAGNIPYDMNANIHKGEMIIPKNFADSVRSGELSIGSGGGGVTVVVNVQGSVTTENDLATTIAKAIYKNRKMGALTI